MSAADSGNVIFVMLKPLPKDHCPLKSVPPAAGSDGARLLPISVITVLTFHTRTPAIYFLLIPSGFFMAAPPGVHTFLNDAHRISREALFITMSLPNADRPAVERTARQLDAVRRVLLNLNDPYTTEDERIHLLNTTNAILEPLEDFLNTPPPPPSTFLPRIYTGLPGRPRYDLNIPRALCLHALGASWSRVATAMGVARRTIYYHLERLGISSTEPQYTDITDDELDEKVAQISLSHPFDGAGIIRGHLKAQNINLPMNRVQESLKRVDPLGVLTRCVSCSSLILSTAFHFLPLIVSNLQLGRDYSSPCLSCSRRNVSVASRREREAP